MVIPTALEAFGTFNKLLSDRKQKVFKEADVIIERDIAPKIYEMINDPYNISETSIIIEFDYSEKEKFAIIDRLKDLGYKVYFYSGDDEYEGSDLQISWGHCKEIEIALERSLKDVERNHQHVMDYVNRR